MVASTKRKHRPRKLDVETEWLRGWASTYLPMDCSLTYSASLFRTVSFTLVHLMHALRRGVVIDADKLDAPGARWIVVSENCDGALCEVVLRVVTDTMHVEVESVRQSIVEDDGNDAA